MTPDEIITLAKQVGFPMQHPDWRKAAEEFAALIEEKVAAKERENWPAEMKAMENQVNILTDELCNLDDETSIKAKAFERLMEILDDKHQLVDSYFIRANPRPLSEIDSRLVDGITIEREHVSVYEWRIRLNNTTDLRQALMDEAAAAIRARKETV